MSNTSMFDTLLGLPLFKGASRERIAEIVGIVKFHFLKYSAGQTIFNAGDPCSHLQCVLSGDVCITFESNNHKFCLEQTLSGPDIVLPEYLFGRATHYPTSAKALTEVRFLQIEKSDYLKILTMDRVFLLNYLNFLSMNAQKSAAAIKTCEGDLRKHIAYVLLALNQPTSKDIKLVCESCRMEDVFNSHVNDLHEALESLHKDKMIDYDSKRIKVTDRRALLQFLLN